MNYKESSIDILAEIIRDLDFTVTIKGYTNMGSGNHVLTVCDMFHAQPGFSVIIGGKTYKITEIIPAVNPACGDRNVDVIKIFGDAQNITATIFELYKPFFFFGTPIQQGIELDKKQQAKDKTPMFWLNWGTLKNHYFEDETENKEREMTVELYALTQSVPEKWISGDFKHNAVDPMERMIQVLIDKIKVMSWRFDQYSLNETISYLPRFGVYIANKGMEKSLWSDKLSGVKMEATITVFTKGYCACPEVES